MSDPPDQQHRRTDVTRLLNRVSAGEGSATDELFPLVYDELQAIARDFMSRERANHTLQPTALVHEAYFRLVGDDVNWESRAHFFGAAARAIRRILIDHARAHTAQKRGGGEKAAALPTAIEGLGGVEPLELLALDEALHRLAALDPLRARVVELRYFAGLTGEETAEALGVSERTVSRAWQFARAWLYRELRGEKDADAEP